MQTKGRITNATTQEPILFATIYESDKDGKPVNNGNNTSSDENGYFQIETTEPNYITARVVGANPQTKKPQEETNFQLTNRATLPEVTVTAKRTYFVPILLAIALIALAD